MSVCRPKFFSDSEDEDDTATTKRKGKKRGTVTTKPVVTKTAKKKVPKKGVVFSSDSEEENCTTGQNRKKEMKEGKKRGKSAASKNPKQIYKKDQIKEMAAAVRHKPHRKKDHCKYDYFVFLTFLHFQRFSRIFKTTSAIIFKHLSFGLAIQHNSYRICRCNCAKVSHREIRSKCALRRNCEKNVTTMCVNI